MIIKILSWLLHHANRHSKTNEYYAIKNNLLSKYGDLIGYDIQHIPGKICFNCDGTGMYYNFDFDQDIECCDCCDGWYKSPQWILLQRIKLDRYTFHQPIVRKRTLENPFILISGTANEVIEGYISHSQTKYGKLALNILLLLFNPKYLFKQYWFYYRMRCKNALQNTLEKALQKLTKKKYYQIEEDLPF